MAKKSNPTSIIDFINHTIPKSKRSSFSPKEKEMLRPIAETIAMLDGNAFFNMLMDDNNDDTWYENYLQEAWRIWKYNGGKDGWAGQASWVKQLEHENESVEEAYINWRLLKTLSKKLN